MKLLNPSFKNNNPAQNLFLFSMFMAFIGAVVSMNFYAVIAWICCYITFVMFCGERDHNARLRQLLDESRESNQAAWSEETKALLIEKNKQDLDSK